MNFEYKDIHGHTHLNDKFFHSEKSECDTEALLSRAIFLALDMELLSMTGEGMPNWGNIKILFASMMISNSNKKVIFAISKESFIKSNITTSSKTSKECLIKVFMIVYQK